MGPVVFEQVADTRAPQIYPYMYFDGKLRKLCCIKAAEAGGTSFLEDRKQNGVMVLNGAGIWRVHFNAQGKGEIENVGVNPIVGQDDGSHLLQFGDGLTFDGKVQEFEKQQRDKDGSAKFVDVAPGTDGRLHPADGDVYRVEMWPADRLYLIGCAPGRGIETDDSAPGAFAPDFSRSPMLRCTLGKGAAFSVQVARRRPH